MITAAESVMSRFSVQRILMTAAEKSDLLDLAHEAVAIVAGRVNDGDCTFHCQLLASKFYEAAKLELCQTASTDERRRLLAAIVERCDRAANPKATPAMILAQLKVALALMKETCDRPVAAGGRPPHQTAPRFRVIQGGLSLAPSR
jgi:hypothetical protein